MKEDEEPQPSSLEFILSLENTLPTFGVTYESLDVLEEDAIKTIYRGSHNIKIPLELIKKLNSDEILSMFYIAGRDKRFNSHHSEVNIQALPKEFPDLLYKVYSSFKNSKACPYSDVAQNLKFVFSESEKINKIRYAQFSESSQKMLRDSYFSNYVCSNKENPFDPKGYIEPETKQEKIQEVLKTLRGISNYIKRENHKDNSFSSS